MRAGDAEKPFWVTSHARAIFFFTLALAVAGVYFAFQIPISVFPKTNFPRIVIGVDNGVMPIEQMQVSIVKPIENAVNSVPGLTTVDSTTSRGSAEVDLFFNWNVNMFRTLELVNAALAGVRQSLPATAQVSTIRLTFASFPILGYSLTSKTISQTRLWEIATYDLKPPLNRLPGVSNVKVMGGQIPEYDVIPNLSRLQESSVTISDIVNAINTSNRMESPGLYSAHHHLILGLVGAQVHNAQQIGQIVVKTTPAGVPIHIADIAQVVPATKPVYTLVMANGQPAVTLSITRQPSGNTVAVAKEVAAKLQQLEKSLPPGVTVQPYYDQSVLVRDSIASVRDAILIGIVLASAVLVLFLRDWSSSLVAGLVIPITILITFVFLHFTGESFNLMTLGGLAAAVGLIIDDAIVVVENIVMHRDLGDSRVVAVRKSLRELTIPLLGSTFTPIVVFVPLISVPGVTGGFFRALAITMAFALLTSLLLALTWTPTLSMYLLHRGKSGAQQEESAGKLMEGILGFHRRVLKLSLARPGMLALCCVVLVIGGFFTFRALGSDLLPKMDEGGFILDYVMPAGSSLQETNRVLENVAAILKSTPEVEGTSRRTGLQNGPAAVTEANTGDFTIKLKKHRSRSVWQVMDSVRSRIEASDPQLQIQLTQILQDNIGDLSNAHEPIAIKLFSDNQTLLNTLSERVGDAIGRISGVVDVDNGLDDTVSGPATSFQVNPAVAARTGFTTQEIATDAQSVLDGVPASQPLIVNGRAYTIRVRLDASHRGSLDAIQNTIFNSATGQTASLGSLATVEQLPPQHEIQRENLQLMALVTARLEGSDLGTAIKRVKAAVNAMHLPSSVRVVYAGAYQEQQKSFHALLRVLVLALVLVFGVLLLEFRNFYAPISILISSVLSITGVVLALLITNTSFNVASFMGLIMVIGIVAKNGILLLDADEQFRAEGMTPHDAMLNAAQRRLRPILMTAIAAIAGMLPLTLGIGSGSQMLQPLAIAVVGGLLISTVLSLIVTPAAYYFMTRTMKTAVPLQHQESL